MSTFLQAFAVLAVLAVMTAVTIYLIITTRSTR